MATSLASDDWPALPLYEELYRARGEMENRIKEQQLYLFADRTSSATMRANQLRLYLSSVAYVLMNELRQIALLSTELARAQCHTIRPCLQTRQFLALGPPEGFEHWAVRNGG